ncbi:MAG: hypothetical protein GXP54_04385 [Deltaproteobacteria bacterium]|nr:hypothetical protein [Deltaproteobacteria bacterium]
MFGKRSRLRAMRAADGEADIRKADREEVESFRGLSEMVRAAESHGQGDPPPFETMWRGVEGRLEDATGQVPTNAHEKAEKPWGSIIFDWIRNLPGDRPVLALAPAGALLLAIVLGALWFLRPVQPSNECFVDSYDVGSGTVIVDQDYDDPQRPTVIWLEEG